MLARWLTVPTPFVLAVILTACGAKNGAEGDGRPAGPSTSPAAPTDQYDPGLAQEYGGLPPTVVIGATADGQGRPEAGTAELRLPPAGATLADAAQAAQAFDAGMPAKVASASELDRDTSTQSWSAYQGVTNYGGYQPAMYSVKRPGYTYSYSNSSQYAQGNRIFYVYQRPACNPVYCAPNGSVPVSAPGGYAPSSAPGVGDYDSFLSTAFKTYGVYATKDSEFYAANAAKIDLGGRLFNDPLLSAKGDIACASCHLDQRGTSNDYALAPIGAVLAGRQSGRLGPAELLTRNTPGLFNLGHGSFATMFWDDRVARDGTQPSGFITPAGSETPPGLESALAAQALFPLIGPTEMGCGVLTPSGYRQSQSPTVLWNAIVARVMARTDYRAMLAAAYPGVNGGVFGIQHLANAIAAFEAVRWKAVNTPFDRYVAGDLGALSDAQKRGATYFYGKGNCGGCHSGPFQTDHFRHAVAVPQLGAGGDGARGWEDYGFARISGNAVDRYKFRTPSLRNVEMTGPWGHDGAWTSLRQVVEHYVDPAQALDHWDPAQVILPAGANVDQTMLAAWLDPQARQALKAANEARPVALAPQEIDDIVAFLLALTDQGVAHNDHTVVKH